jgi:hypothetical protein
MLAVSVPYNESYLHWAPARYPGGFEWVREPIDRPWWLQTMGARNTDNSGASVPSAEMQKANRLKTIKQMTGLSYRDVTLVAS